MHSTVMQQQYSPKELREMLGRLANAHSADEAEEFLKAYGPLRERAQGDPRNQGGLPLSLAEVIEYARRFREAWEWRTKPDFDYRQFNRMLEGIFAAGDPIAGERPAIRANFRTGTWEPFPQDRLQMLAMQLMADRKMLKRCARCQRYFVSNKSREKYCKFLVQYERELDRVATCAEVMRRRGQYRSAEQHREEINRRRRKPKGKGKK